MTPHRDRRAGLILFGVLLIAAGLTCALLVPLLGLGQVVVAPGGQDALSSTTLMPALLAYAGLAVVFVWLGIGSILARRWAPPLILTLGWVWLMTGVAGVGLVLVALPSALATATAGGDPLPPEVAALVTGTVLGVSGVVLVILPAALILFFRSAHVRATCEVSDPRPRWTDHCPPSLLGLSLSLGLMAVSLVPAVLSPDALVPCFGWWLTGIPAIVVNLSLAGVWFGCAWGLCRRDRRAWWMTAASTSLAAASALATFVFGDVSRIVPIVDLPPGAFDLPALFSRPALIGMTAAAWLSVIGSLAYVRRLCGDDPR